MTKSKSARAYWLGIQTWALLLSAIAMTSAFAEEAEGVAEAITGGKPGAMARYRYEFVDQ